MSDFDSTALNATTRELWDEKIEDARYANGVLFKRVSNKSDVCKFNDILHITLDNAYSVGTVSASGGFTPQNYAPATVDITINQWEQIAIQILDRAKAQSFWTPASTFPTNVGKAFASRYDAQLAGEWANVGAGNSIGSTSTPAPFGKDLAQEGMLRLAATNIPLDELSFVLHPSSYYTGLCNEGQYTSADQAGLDKSVLQTGKVNNLFGHPVFLCTNIVSTGTPAVRKNLLLHKSALAIAWQKNAAESLERTRSTANLVLADLLVAQALYGFVVVRSDHFVVLNSAA